MAGPHAYIADLGIPADHRGARPCRCGRPERNRIHDAAEAAKTAEAQTEHLRRIGGDQ